MLTRCPACNTWFRIRPEHLQAAGGEVQCGRCFTRFNALENLAEGSEVPPAAEAAREQSRIEAAVAAKSTESDAGAPAGAEPAASEAGPEAEAPPIEGTAPSPQTDEPREESPPEIPADAPGPQAAEEAEPQAAEKVPRAEAESTGSTAEGAPEETGAATAARTEEPLPGLDALPKEPGVKWTAVEIDDDWRMDKLIGDADVDTEAPPRKSETNSRLGPPQLVELDLPLTLRGESGRKAARRGRRRTLLWAVGALFLLIALGVQYAYFHRMKLLAAYPAARPFAAHLCKRLGCTLPVQRDLSDIHVVNRDVREHPNFAGTLLVNATIVNDAKFAQPYPTLQLSLYDDNGTLLGLRRFKPSEYLDGSINIPAGMQPHKPVHVVLEVAGASNAATSFQFQFL